MTRWTVVALLVALACHEPEPLPPFEQYPTHHLYDPLPQSDATATATPPQSVNTTISESLDASSAADASIDSSTPAHGGLAAEEIRHVVMSHSGQLRRCYDRDGAPPTPGSLVAAWEISAAGKVESATIVGGTLLGTPMATCVVDEILTWQFPAASSRTKVVAYPFKFGVH